MGRLARLLSIRPGEARTVLLLAAAFASVEMGRGLGELGVDTLVVSRVGASALPPLFVALGLVGLVATLAYGAALARSRNERFFPLLLLVLAAVLGVEWVVALSGTEAAFPALWVTVYAAGLLLLTAMWTVAGFSFDARQARRLFPLLTSAAIGGSLAGFLGAIVVQRLVGAEQLILAEAALLCLAAGLLAALGGRIRPRRGAAGPPSLRSALTEGGAYVLRSRLMRLVSLAYVLLAILLFSVTFPFMRAMGEAFPDEAQLISALALISAAVTVASFLLGTLVANRLYARFGVAGVALALPVVYAAGFGLWLVRFTPTTAVVVRVAQQITQRGLSNAAWSAFFTSVPGHRRGQVMAFIDGVPGQLGTMLSGVLLILAASLALEQVFLMGLVTALVCFAVGLGIRRAYASSLVATLREGLAEQVLEGGPGLASLGRDARVLAGLRAASVSERPADRQLAAELLGRLGQVPGMAVLGDLERLSGDVAPAVRRAALVWLGRLGGAAARARLVSATSDDDPLVRASALEALGRLDVEVGLDAAARDRLADDPSPLVRAELAVALTRTGRAEEAAAIVEGLLGSSTPAERAAGLGAVARFPSDLQPDVGAQHLADPAAEVRAAALAAVAARSGDGLGPLLDGLRDPSPVVRHAAVAALRERPAAEPALLGILDGEEGPAQEAALVALGGRADELRGALIEWSTRQVARAASLRMHASALRGEGSPSAAFLAQVVERREKAIEGRLLTALATLGAPEASGLIRRCLRSVDPEVRAQAIEALDALGDARLARGVVRLLDSDAGSAPSDPAHALDAIRELGDDRDAWVRALALRTLAERRPEERATILTRAAGDPHPVVRVALPAEQGEEHVDEGFQLVSDLDRMLVLRRVPLFEALTPEDLQRVATTAVERTWSGGEALMTEGEVADELVVIVDGRVRVVRGGPEGERLLRTFGPGDHIGELAVLREAPRAATVIAEDPGVRGLVIGGVAVQAILQERPEAAMAMLATLAERLSQQS